MSLFQLCDPESRTKFTRQMSRPPSPRPIGRKLSSSMIAKISLVDPEVACERCATVRCRRRRFFCRFPYLHSISFPHLVTLLSLRCPVSGLSYAQARSRCFNRLPT
ncbi:hypothetical protein Y032_0011g1402 [Ancylostoma ceylanicum]|uniref:Uncharacterized protein n=1 Tax=Ancylostoma ceylanicum TaxID=53326 RepID=A0A016VDS5_9BILA|nr:hypothetical protein Y032_0011g1402 [Ancylostoma ceylanicum]